PTFYHGLLAVCLPLALLAVLRVGILFTDGEIDPDAFYHAKLAELGPDCFLAKSFPATSMSIWKDHYSDKELGFHLLLWGLFRLRSVCGLSNSFPFHLPNLLFVAGFLSIFTILLCRWRIQMPVCYTLLLIALYYGFTLRLLFLRAYLLSMILFIAVLLLLSAEKWRQRPSRGLILFFLGFIYSWCYSSPHLILLPILPFVLAEFLATGKRRNLLLLPGLAMAGVFSGLLLHPQFPNTFYIFWIQSWQVIKMFTGMGPEANIHGGNELYLRVWSTLRYAPFLILLPVLLAVLLYWQRNLFLAAGWRQKINLNAMLLLSAGSSLAFLWQFRFAEYALPALVLCSALLLQNWDTERKRQGQKELGKKVAGFYALLALLITLPVLSSLEGKNHRPFSGLAQWTREQQIPAGTIIANLRWGSFPMLFYAMPQYCYLNGLEPMFAFAFDPVKARLVEDTLRQRIIPSPKELYQATNATFLHISIENRKLAEKLYQVGYKLVYQNWDGWLFLLETS
ncbi:MAG: hypothetical protein WCT05_06405, partial [Lentisphaeria bacterium]